MEVIPNCHNSYLWISVFGICPCRYRSTATCTDHTFAGIVSAQTMLINNAFPGKQWLIPFFNRSNNEDLILVIQSAGVSNGRNGLLPCGCEKFTFHDTFALSVSGVS